MAGLIADTHVHIYPLFDQLNLVLAAKDNLARLRTESTDQLGIFLTERADCDYFSRLGALKSSQFKISTAAGVHEILFSDNTRLWVFQGYQINTLEKIELLALTATTRVPDRLPFEKAIEAIVKQSGIAVACWAFGKWCGKRGTILHDYLQRSQTCELMLADSALRFHPSRFLARSEHALLAGTDPLPLRSEELRIGRFATRYTSGFEPEAALESARKLLLNSTPQIVGTRLGCLAAFRRVLQMNLGAGKVEEAFGTS